MALYIQPLLWVGLAIVAVVKLEFIWLSLVGTFTFIYPSSSCLVGNTGLIRIPGSDRNDIDNHEYPRFFKM